MYKDTVMSDERLGDFIRDNQTGRPFKTESGIARSVAQSQAEISFKAGEVEGYKQGLEMREPYKAGVKEVVDWLLVDDNMPLSDEYKYPPRTVAQIRNKLKDWGIDG